MRLLSISVKSTVLFVLTLFFFSQIQLNAQQSSIDFNLDFHQFQGFLGNQFAIVQGPDDPANNVGRWVNVGDVWEGAFLQAPEAVFLDSIKTITLKFYAAANDNNEVLVKLEDNFQQDVEVKQTVADTGWTTLSFDFSQATETGTNNIVNASGSFERIVIFVNGGTVKTGTYFIDDITYPNFELTNSIDVIYTDLAYEDEFNYTGPIDTAQWFPEVVPPNPWGWFNGEQQHYTNRTDNVNVSKGTLKITAKKETFTAYGLTLDYTSARLNSKFNFTYGRIDVRAKMPRGDGTWPALWMLGTSIGNNWHPTTKPWPDCGEIDIMEHWGNDSNVVHGSTHTISSNGATVNTEEVKRAYVSQGFHVYSVNWSPNQISFLMDGFLYYAYNPQNKNASTWPFDDPQFVILNVAMGGIYPIDPNFTESTMEVDYVRVYQNNIDIGENTLKARFEVYPNPANNHIVIEAEREGDFVLYDLLGKEVLNLEIDPSPGKTVDLPELPDGTYVWHFVANQGSKSGKLQIIKN